MSEWLLVALICLATFRVTRLVIQDTFPPIGVPRDHLLNWWEPDGDWIADHPKASPHWGALGRSLRYLLTCPWCMSPWVGAGVYYIATRFPGVARPFLIVAAASAVTGLIARNLDPD